MTSDRNDSAETGSRHSSGSSEKPPVSSSKPDMSWVMHSLNQIQEDIGSIRERVARIEENIKPIPQMEKRLRRIENIIWTVGGVLIAGSVIWGAVKWISSNYDLIPKP